MATITDIAKKVGVSTMTVSRVFNSPDKVKPQTLQAVQQAAQELNYHPNNVARSLARKCTNIVFVYIPEGLSATEQFVSQTVTAIGERLGEHGYSFLLRRTLPQDESFDGMIMMGLSHDEESIVEQFTNGKPVVLYGNSDKFTSWVDVDNYSGEWLATEYLINKGYKNICAVCAPQKMHYAEERLCGYKDCLTSHGLSINDQAIAIGQANEQGGYDCTNRLIQSGVAMDAIVCATDTMAIGCMRALKEQGVAVPNDVAVVGFDGFGHENLVTPKLTTVKQPLFEVGFKLADLLVSLLDGTDSQKIKILPTLVIGESA